MPVWLRLCSILFKCVHHVCAGCVCACVHAFVRMVGQTIYTRAIVLMLLLLLFIVVWQLLLMYVIVASSSLSIYM
jgi:hypothetical protein